MRAAFTGQHLDTLEAVANLLRLDGLDGGLVVGLGDGHLLGVRRCHLALEQLHVGQGLWRYNGDISSRQGTGALAPSNMPHEHAGHEARQGIVCRAPLRPGPAASSSSPTRTRCTGTPAAAAAILHSLRSLPFRLPLSAVAFAVSCLMHSLQHPHPRGVRPVATVWIRRAL
jgi:hypothetical protein